MFERSFRWAIWDGQGWVGKFRMQIRRPGLALIILLQFWSVYSKRTSIRGKAETSVCPADRPTSGDLCSTGGSPWTLCCYDIEFWPAPNVLVCSCRDGEGRYLCNAGHSRACTSIIGADGPVPMPASQPTPEPNEPTNEPTNLPN